jgi:chromatin structure-remodeling complex subunit RSC9
VPSGNILLASDFIHNVSTTFSNAQAQVIETNKGHGRDDESPGDKGKETSLKFVIQGIRPIAVPLDLDGFPFHYCKWEDTSNSNKDCHKSFSDTNELRKHVLVEHMKLEPLSTPGEYNLNKAITPHFCCWRGCNNPQSAGPSDDLKIIIDHVCLSHLPAERTADTLPVVPPRKILQEKLVSTTTYYDTVLDEENEPMGISYKAALILRNILRNTPKERAGPSHNNLHWSVVLMGSHRSQLTERCLENRTIRNVLTEILSMIE